VGRKIRKRDADDRPSRRRWALRSIEDREWDRELRRHDEALEADDDLPAVPSGSDGGCETEEA
jgi:hypothetical protein